MLTITRAEVDEIRHIVVNEFDALIDVTFDYRPFPGSPPCLAVSFTTGYEIVGFGIALTDTLGAYRACLVLNHGSWERNSVGFHSTLYWTPEHLTVED